MSEQETVCNVVPCRLDEESFIFVSYAHHDSDAVFPIIEDVGSKGYAIWYDKGISISSTWTDEIATAILNCAIFVMFITKESAESMYVRSEIEFALNNRVKVMPVYLDGMDVLPPGLALGLSATQGITDARDPESAARQICAALESNGVARKDAGKSANIKYKRRMKNSRAELGKLLRLAAAVIALIAVAFVLSGFISRSDAKRDNYSFKIEKRVFAPAEPIQVELRAVTQKMIERGAIIGVARASDKQGDYISYEFIDEDVPGIKLRAPLEDGDYVVRGYGSGSEFSESTLVGAVPFTVSGDSSGTFGLAIDRREYAPSENILVSVTGVPKYMLDDGAEVILSKAGEKPGEYIVYMVISTRDEQFTFSAPLDPGEYEMRAYSNNDVYAESTVAAREKFSVLGKEAYPFVIEPDKSSYAPGAQIAARVLGVAHNIGGGAILALSAAGSGPGEYISSERIYEKNASITLKAPSEPGEYELRGYWDRNVLTESGLAACIPFKVEDLGQE
ncbi:MAG: toll/interleukin-1 receptor domain-containing protein [Synergistaceae bacterium]|jgi:hypothetical protein|nr:toll/interleukin-1 receptor domain-containing protein [Synergistaceae bacterium]